MENKPRNTKEDYRRARHLRNDASPFERKLWDGMRKIMTIKNIKFRRQQAIHPYIIDFACMKARLLIELDGDSHDTRQNYDARRDEELKNRGFHILRFNNQDIAASLEGILDIIFDEAERLIRDNKSNHVAFGDPPSLTLPTEGEGTAPLLSQRL